MRAEIKCITPELAAELLEHNYEDNRNMRKSYANQLATVMRNGRYVSENGQTIVLGEDDGVLYDGQHRLAAITQSGCAQTMLVVWITNGKEAYKTIDNGTKRNAADFLKLPDRNAVAAAAKVMGCVEYGNAPLLSCLTGSMGNKDKIDRGLIVAYAEQHAQQLVESCRMGNRMRRAVNCGSQGLFAIFIELVTYCGTDEYLREFIEEFTKPASESLTVTAAKTAIMRMAARRNTNQGIDKKWLLGTLLDAYTHFRNMDDSTMFNKQAQRFNEYAKLMQAKRDNARGAAS